MSEVCSECWLVGLYSGPLSTNFSPLAQTFSYATGGGAFS